MSVEFQQGIVDFLVRQRIARSPRLFQVLDLRLEHLAYRASRSCALCQPFSLRCSRKFFLLGFQFDDALGKLATLVRNNLFDICLVGTILFRLVLRKIPKLR